MAIAGTGKAKKMHLENDYIWVYKHVGGVSTACHDVIADQTQHSHRLRRLPPELTTLHGGISTPRLWFDLGENGVESVKVKIVMSGHHGTLDFDNRIVNCG